MWLLTKLKMLFQKPQEENKPSIISPEESKELYQKINENRLEEIEKKILILAVSVNKLTEQIMLDREYLVQIATLHEELLYQLDQGNVVMLKQKGGNADGDDSLEEKANYSHFTSEKKKFEIN